MSDLPRRSSSGTPRTELRRRLVEAVLAGEKTATAGLAELEDEPEDEPASRLRASRLRRRAGRASSRSPRRESYRRRKSTKQFARDEGEGFESVEDWRVAHERFFEQPIEPDTLIEASASGSWSG